MRELHVENLLVSNRMTRKSSIKKTVSSIVMEPEVLERLSATKVDQKNKRMQLSRKGGVIVQILGKQSVLFTEDGSQNWRKL